MSCRSRGRHGIGILQTGQLTGMCKERGLASAMRNSCDKTSDVIAGHEEGRTTLSVPPRPTQELRQIAHDPFLHSLWQDHALQAPRRAGRRLVPVRVPLRWGVCDEACGGMSEGEGVRRGDEAVDCLLRAGEDAASVARICHSG
jgi:hypothetical protein